jgi:hypothetical protein
MTLSHNARKIQDLKIQIAGETKARIAAENRAKEAELRAARAEFRERECDATMRKLRQRVDELEAALKSRGLEA